MQLTKPFVLFFRLALFSGALLAQGSGTTIPRSPGPGYRDSYAVTRSVTGILEELNEQGKTLQIVDEKSGQSLTFALGEKTKLRADKKVLGKTKISWSDLETGHRVRVKFVLPSVQVAELSIHDIEVKEIKVLKPRRES